MGRDDPACHAGLASHTSIWFGGKRYDFIVRNAENALRVGLKKLLAGHVLTKIARPYNGCPYLMILKSVAG